MNLQLVPKYKKYNKPLNQVFVVSVPASLRESPGHLPGYDLPVPVKIEPYKQKKNRKPRGNVRLGPVYSIPEPKSPISRFFLKKTTTAFSPEPEKRCPLSRWWAKRKALKKLKAEYKHRAEQAESWRSWKQQEAKRIEEAKRQDAFEDARREREAEYMRQMHEIEEQKRRMAKDTLKARYPYPAVKKKPPKESFSRILPTEPYCPKPVEYTPSYDDDVPVVTPNVKPLENRQEIKKKNRAEKREIEKKIQAEKREIEKQIRAEKREIKKEAQAEKREIKKEAQAEKREIEKKIQAEKREIKKKKWAEKREVKIKKRNEKPKIKKYKQKITKTKQQKIKKTDFVERKSYEHSQRFVNCFYKTCCLCYCWLTIFLAIGVLIIMVV